MKTLMTLILVFILNLQLATPAKAEVIFVAGGLTSDIMCNNGHDNWCVDQVMELGTITGVLAAAMTYFVGAVTSAIVGIWNPSAAMNIWFITKVLDEKGQFNQAQLEGTLQTKYPFIDNHHLIVELSGLIKVHSVQDAEGNSHVSLAPEVIDAVTAPYGLCETEIQKLVADFK